MTGDVWQTGAPTDDRMRAAVDLTGPDPSAASLALVRRSTGIAWKRGTAVLVGAMVVGAVVGVMLAMRDRPFVRVPVAEWRTTIGWLLWAAGLIGAVWTFVVRRRSGHARTARRRLRPMQVLTTAQRKSVHRQIRGKAAVEPAQLPLLRYVAETIVGSRLQPWLFLPVVALLMGNAVRTDHPIAWVSAGIVVVLTACAGPAGSRRQRRARAFLARHPMTP